MKRSTDRILTTHVGSLPRPDDLFALMLAKADGKPFDEKAYAARLQAAVKDIVRQQVELGIDIVNDGEMGKPSFITYVGERLGGLEQARGRAAEPVRALARVDLISRSSTVGAAAQVERQPPARTHGLRRAHAATRGSSSCRPSLPISRRRSHGVAVAEAFVPAIAPSNVEVTQPNEYYPNEEAYLFAVADAMREEYQAIVAAGFLLQIDDPFLVSYYIMRPDLDIAACRKWAHARVEALNHALAGIPEDRIRFHTCYSINMGPRVHDMELKDVVDIILKVRAGAYSFEAANPRHEHEWKVWKDAKLPDDKILIPGVITQSTVLVEHPELVAERLVRFADVVGRERVIAGADCGFASFAGSNEVHPSITWAKFQALAEGARLASKRLW